VIKLEASGKETRGAGTASATVRSVLEGKDGETHVTVHTTLNVTGRPAQFGRGVMAEVGGKLIGIFATNLADMLSADGQSGADKGAEDSGDDLESDLGSAGGSADLDQTIDVLNLPVRSYNGLRRAGIDTVADLTSRTGEDLLAIDNIGPASVEEIRQKLALLGLTLSDSPASSNGVPGAPSRAAAPATPTRAAAPATPSRAATPASADSGSATATPSAADRSPLRDVSHDGRASDDAIDLLGVAGLPVLKRALPVVAAVAAAALIALGIRSRLRGRRSSHS